MKNLLIFINPIKNFYAWYEALCKIQIENSLLLGWKKEDILLVTNFDYEYGGIKSLVVNDSLYCVPRRRASKINVIYYLLDNEIIKDLCWFHDFDAYQLQPFTEIESEIDGLDIAMTDYGWCTRSNTASFFFKPGAKDIMGRVRDTVYRYRTNEETSLDVLIRRNMNNINNRYKKLNCTYSLGGKRLSDHLLSLEKAIKPLKVININPRSGEFFERYRPFMSNELLSIFKRHGFG